MYKFLVSILVFIIGFVVTQRVLAWDHTVIMSPFEGSSYTVPLPEGRACIYVTDCTENILTTPAVPSTPPPSSPTLISEIPNIVGTEGWSFFDVVDRSEWAIEVDDEETSDATKADRYQKAHAIDDDPTTIWHTRWVDPATPMPH